LADAAPFNPKIVVHGAGSVGCWIGGTWAAAGLDVTLIGRERIGREIAEHGLNITDSDGGRIALVPDAIRFSTRAKDLAAADIVALCVKSNGTADAAKELARHAKKGATVISFQNGVSNVDLLKEALPKLNVLRAMVPFNVAALGKGRWHKGVAGSLWAEDHEVTRALAAHIGRRPGRLHLSDDMVGVAWGKLLINLNNAINALSGRTLLEELSSRDYRRVWAAAQIEALAVLKAAGIEPAKTGPIAPRLMPHVIGAPDFLFRRVVLKRQKIDANARSSMADDFAAGRPTEIDWLNGEVVRLAHKLGRKAPVNEAIVDLVRQAEAGVERLWGAADLRAHVLGRHRGAPGFGY
jgi:2-dehydropantoate 2-reductase